MSERRRMMMGVKKLPYDAEIEYLESTGNQWINTNVIATLNTSIDIKFAFSQLFTDHAVIGMDSGTAAIKSFNLEYFNNTSGICLSLDGVGPAIRTRMIPVANTFYTVYCANNNLTVNGTRYYNNTGKIPSSFTGDYPLIMFAYGRNGTPLIYGKNKVCYCKIYNNGTIVRDFTPVRVGQVGYMYDKVSSQLFGNAGTGNFTLGSDVN